MYQDCYTIRVFRENNQKKIIQMMKTNFIIIFKPILRDGFNLIRVMVFQLVMSFKLQLSTAFRSVVI